MFFVFSTANTSWPAARKTLGLRGITWVYISLSGQSWIWSLLLSTWFGSSSVNCLADWQGGILQDIPGCSAKHLFGRPFSDDMGLIELKSTHSFCNSFSQRKDTFITGSYLPLFLDCSISVPTLWKPSIILNNLLVNHVIIFLKVWNFNIHVNTLQKMLMYFFRLNFFWTFPGVSLLSRQFLAISILITI